MIKSKILQLTISILSLLTYSSASAQCIPVTDTTGVIYNAAMDDSVSFNVTFSPTCMFINLGSFTGVCGLTFPGVMATWSGNTNGSTSTITYAFSKAVSSIDILIGYTGVNGIIAPETFLFTTNSVTPSVFVNAGNCIPWTINGNSTTSPNINGGLNSIHTITAITPFDSLTITTNSSGSGPGANGGSSFAICDGNLLIGIENSIVLSPLLLYPNPTKGVLNILLPPNYTAGNNGRLVIYNVHGKLISTTKLEYGSTHTILSLTDHESGLYFVEYTDSQRSLKQKFLIVKE